MSMVTVANFSSLLEICFALNLILFIFNLRDLSDKIIQIYFNEAEREISMREKEKLLNPEISHDMSIGESRAMFGTAKFMMENVCNILDSVMKLLNTIISVVIIYILYRSGLDIQFSIKLIYMNLIIFVTFLLPIVYIASIKFASRWFVYGIITGDHERFSTKDLIYYKLIIMIAIVSTPFIFLYKRISIFIECILKSILNYFTIKSTNIYSTLSRWIKSIRFWS